MSKIVINGANKPTLIQDEERPPRLEIHDFVKDEKQFSLYIQALPNFYKRSYAETTSYFQIAGIHAERSTWNEFGIPDGKNEFCVHDLPTFPTWHRPYNALLDQELQKEVLTIAETYTVDKPGWKKAAEHLRQPYWGWDERDTFIPPDEVITNKEVEITIKDGTKKKVSNPLLAGTFPEKTAYYGLTTYRNDNLKGILEAVRDNSDFLQKVDSVFTADSWDEFRKRSENLHNTIHGRTGGSMATFKFAPYDPIFWQHHTQVDRFPDEWTLRGGLWTTDLTDLIPFPSGQDKVWKSPEIKQASTFNYRNPPFSQSNNLPSERSVPELHLYARQAISSFASEPGQASPSVFLDELSQHLGVSIPKYDNPSDLIPALESFLPDWRLRVSIKKFEIGGSFSVFIFLGGVPADPAQWLFDPTFVGTFDIFSNENPETCSNCIKHRDLVIDGFVHLNSSILKQSGKIALDEKHVLPYLEKLSWGVQKADGEIVGLDKLSSLKVSIDRTHLTLPTGAPYPKESQHVLYKADKDGHWSLEG